jgi:hypothetical protein
MVDNSVPSDPQCSANNEKDREEATLRAVAETAKKDHRRENAKRYANAAKHKLHICLIRLKSMFFSSSVWTAAATVAMAVTTIVYTRYAEKQWGVTENQLTEMQSMDRPWIKIIDVAPASEMTGVAMETWDFTNPNNPGFMKNPKTWPFPPKGAELWFKANYKNVGHSPAFGITAVYELYLPKVNEKGGDLLNEQQRFCALAPDKSSTGWQAVLFPDENLDGGAGVQAAINSENSVTHEDGIHFLANLIVCINYQFDRSTVKHHTAAAYELSYNDHRIAKVLPSHEGLTVFSVEKVSTDIRPEDLFFRRLNYADRAD